MISNNELLIKIRKEATTSKSRGLLLYTDNISQNNKKVKSTKYSMHENTNNAQELDKSSFFLKKLINYKISIKNTENI